MKALSNEYKAPKGLIRVNLLIDEDGTIKQARITGDFFIYPEEKILDIEKSLVNIKFERKDVEKAIKEVFADNNICAPFISAEDFIEAIINSKPRTGD